MVKKLTVKQERFAQEYVSSGNASAAYRAAYDAEGMTDEAVHVSASRVKAKVTLRIAELQAMEAEKYSMTRADVMKQWFEIANADPNDLVQVRRESCSECYAGKHCVEPRIDCPGCSGEGEACLYVADTRKLSKQAKLLYAGARITRYGVEVVLRDRDDALNNIARALNMFNEHGGKSEQMQIPSSLSEITKDPIEAARIYEQIMKG